MKRVLATCLALTAVLGCLQGEAAAPPGELAVEDASFASLTPPECYDSYGGLLVDQAYLAAPDFPVECVDYFDRLSAGPCHDLIARVCGDLNQCGDSGACAAAWLCAEFDDARCQAALADLDQYPPCDAESMCSALVEHVCGAEPGDYYPCRNQPACHQAELLWQGADEAACREALQEPTLYPHCSS